VADSPQTQHAAAVHLRIHRVATDAPSSDARQCARAIRELDALWTPRHPAHARVRVRAALAEMVSDYNVICRPYRL